MKKKKRRLKWEIEPESKEAKKLLKSFEAYIIENYGERCEVLACKCACCTAWQLYDLVKVMIF